MKAARIEQPGQGIVTEVPEPVPGADDVLIKVRAAGICGTDLHIFKGEYEATYPIIPGHEFSGVVVAVGANVKNFRVGDRVTADPNVPCGRCPNCQRNEPNQCQNLQAIGVTRSGAFSEYVIAPEGNVFQIGDLSYSAAALVEPLACVVWGIKRIDGVTLVQEFRWIILPLALPGLMATMLLCFIFAWNEFFLAFNLTVTKAAPLSVFIASFKTSEGLFWAKMSAAATITALPVVLAGWLAQHQLVRGLTAGAVK